jgi:hypothetical protein
VKKSASKLNSSVISVYSEGPMNKVKSNKDTLNNISMSSYNNIGLSASQYKTLNDSMLECNEVDLNKISDSRNFKNQNLQKCVASTNSHINPQKLLDFIMSK